MSGSKKKKAVRWLLLALVVAVVVWLLVSIYITKSLTWKDVYGALGLQSGPATVQGEGFDGVSVTVLYVGQGDSIYIQAGETNVLVDAGCWDSYDDIDGFLAASGVDRIDYLFASHPHTDHIGSVSKILQDYEVEEIIINQFDPSLTPTNSTYREYLDAIAASGVYIRQAQQGETIPFDKGEMEVISEGWYSDLNNSSLMLCYTYGDTSFLLTGDCEYEAEDDLLAQGLIPPCDVLKAGHHGTKNATSMDFLRAVEPAYVAVSCGIDNDYGYPKEKFMNRVERAGAELYRTDTDGNITFLSDGSNIEVITGSQRASGQ